MELNKEFLKSYFPKNRFFTSNEEIEMVDKNILLSGEQISELDKKTINEIRNQVVEFYDPLISREDDFKYMTPMMSITSILEHFIYK